MKRNVGTDPVVKDSVDVDGFYARTVLHADQHAVTYQSSYGNVDVMTREEWAEAHSSSHVLQRGDELL